MEKKSVQSVLKRESVHWRESVKKRESVLSAGKVPKEGKCIDYVYVDICVNGVC